MEVRDENIINKYTIADIRTGTPRRTRCRLPDRRFSGSRSDIHFHLHNTLFKIKPTRTRAREHARVQVVQSRGAPSIREEREQPGPRRGRPPGVSSPVPNVRSIPSRLDAVSGTHIGDTHTHTQRSTDSKPAKANGLAPGAAEVQFVMRHGALSRATQTPSSQRAHVGRPAGTRVGVSQLTHCARAHALAVARQ